MSVLEALRAGGIEARVLQPVYLEPFPVWELDAYRDEKPIVVEQSAAGQFAALLAEKARIDASQLIRRYDGRPFDPLSLAEEIGEAISRHAP
jgi:2-oxoglutarate ferredoxin oxidoreductase subunit alpha